MNRRYFCIRGYMKSGTNWLGSLLNTHPAASSVGEFHWQRVLEPFLQRRDSQPRFAQPPRAEKMLCHFEEMIRRCMAEVADPEAAIVGDRTPHTIVPLTLRDADYISIMRDGRDVLVSRVFHLYNHPETTGLFDLFPAMASALKSFQTDPWYFQKNPKRLLFPERMVCDSIVAWRDHVHSDHSAPELHPNLRVEFVQYEQLHRDPQEVRDRLLKFLGVDPALAEAIPPRLHPGFSQERPDEFKRKGIVGDWRNYFTEENKTWFKELAGQTLIDFGYAETMDW